MTTLLKDRTEEGEHLITRNITPACEAANRPEGPIDERRCGRGSPTEKSRIQCDDMSASGLEAIEPASGFRGQSWLSHTGSIVPFRANQPRRVRSVLV